MAGPGLPVNIDAVYADSGTDASVKAHQQHHDALHNIANDFDVANATTARYVPIGNGSALVTRALLSADIADLAVGSSSVRTLSPSGDSSGATDTTVITNAIATGDDIYLRSGAWYTNATIANGTGRIEMSLGGMLYPTFRGDAIFVQTNSPVNILISGAHQPSSGDFSAVAAIRIGGAGGSNPQQGSIAGCSIESFKGTGVIWEQGSMIDFSRVRIYSTTYDGIVGTANYDDNNHGLFSLTHVISCTGIGFSFPATISNSNLNSRHHVFSDAKAYSNGQNFNINTIENVGTVFSETSGTPCTFGSLSWANNIDVIGIPTDYESWVDNGYHNLLWGHSGSDNTRDVKQFFARSVQVNAAATLYSGSGVPSSGTGSNGDFYLRTGAPGTANQRLYVRNAGAWSGIL